ncbi:MAG TPA: O-methyltransferase [Halanaerobiales bacterium]|nr:O-methyltransferase [Halanaerobiales bacterium]
MAENKIYTLWEDNERLKELEQQAKEEHIPIISRETANILKSIISIKKPKLILELGTAIGYSTLWMAEYTDSDTEIVTVERDEKRFKQAQQNIEDFGFNKKLNFKFGDAREIVPYLRRKFDLIFIDAAKGQYLNLFKMAEGKIKEDGIIICDNVLYKGLVRNNQKVEHKIRSMVVNMRKFLIYLKNNKRFKTEILDIDDGITISSRRNR